MFGRVGSQQVMVVAAEFGEVLLQSGQFAGRQRTVFQQGAQADLQPALPFLHQRHGGLPIAGQHRRRRVGGEITAPFVAEPLQQPVVVGHDQQLVQAVERVEFHAAAIGSALRPFVGEGVAFAHAAGHFFAAHGVIIGLAHHLMRFHARPFLIGLPIVVAKIGFSRQAKRVLALKSPGNIVFHVGNDVAHVGNDLSEVGNEVS